MIFIEMQNITSKVYGLNNTIKVDILRKLSYQIHHFQSKSEQMFIFNPDTNETYTGLIPHIINILKAYNLEYKIIDNRIKPGKNANFNIKEDFKARDYQEEIIKRASSREIIQCATGGGKTFIISSLIAKFNVKPVIVVAPKISLAMQLQSELKKFLGIEIGLIGGGINNPLSITICTPLSIINNPLIKEAKAIFYDEVQFLPSKTLFSIAIKAVNAYYRIGVSATPWRDGGDDILIEAALNIRKPNLNLNASKLIAKKVLVPCTINFINVNSNTEWLGNYHKTYDAAIVNNQIRNKIIVNLTYEMVNNNKTVLILISKIKHGEYLLNEIKKNLNYTEKFYIDPETKKFFMIGNVEFISGCDNLIKRNLVFQAVKDGFCKVLIGSTIADEGLDLPILDTLILAGSGKSSTRAFQRIGRVLRLHPNKNNAIVFDFIDSYKTFYNQAMLRKLLYETESLWKLKVI